VRDAGLLGAGVSAGADDRIPELRSRVDLVELVAQLGGVEAKRSGMGVTFHCPSPAHEDRTPSFTVKDGRWNCWSACARGGDAIDLVMWLRGCTTAEAIEQLAAGVGLDRRPERSPAPTLTKWCAGRGWGPHVVAELGLTLVEDAYGRPRIRFPFRLDGEVPYHQDRSVDDSVKYRWLSPPGGRPIAYEADRLRLAHEERGHVFVLEGVTDVVALVDVYASPAVVGIPGVAAWRPSWAPAFRGLNVYVIGDNDPAGERFRSRVTTDLQGVARAVWNVHVPDGFVDVAAWRRGLGPEAFDAQLMAACEAVAPDRLRMAG
jgi:DNA primase